jgi:hypothetical protein
MKMKLTLLTLAATSLVAAGGSYTFNSGDSEGWTYRLVNATTGHEIRTGAASWSDINNVPNVFTDPVGDDQGAAQAVVSAADYSAEAAPGDYLVLQFISPDLTASSSWQAAASCSAYLLPSFSAASWSPDISANIGVVINDWDTGTERSFVNGTATPLTTATWTKRDFDLGATFASASPPVTRREIVQVTINFWIAVAADRYIADPLLFDIDGVSSKIEILVPSRDYGDAPEGYPVTEAENGASHTRAANWQLGANWDAEYMGSHSADADYDDTHSWVIFGADDEDGVTVGSTTGTISVNVLAGTNGLLNAWVDFNRDGDWDDANEQVFTNRLLSVGNNGLFISVPSLATSGDFVSRWRFSETGGLTPRGDGGNGEVEDHMIRDWRCENCPPSATEELDFGDAPDDGTNYFFNTLLIHDGARHVRSSLLLGHNWDSEVDGQPSPMASRDDNHGTPDDEDGVRLHGVVFDPVSSTPTYVPVYVSGGPGVLDAWIDWNRDRRWDASEHAIAGTSVVSGWNTIPVFTPGGISNGVRYARFRLSSTGTPDWYGLASDGEVEDYRVRVRAGGATNNPRLWIQRSGESAVVGWAEEGMMLEQANTPSGPWTLLPEATSPHVIQPNAPKKFFRLIDGI